MKIEHLAPQLLKPYPGNPRLNDDAVAAVAESIRRFGFRQPIVVDKNRVIVVGHTRWRAAIAAGLTSVPVHVAVDMSPEQIRAYRIADNKTAEAAEWNKEALAAELQALAGTGIDWGLLGFEAPELTKLLPGTASEPAADADEAPPVPKRPVTKAGDIIQLGEHRLVCGDAMLADTYRKLMDGTTATMMFTDPPWNVGIGTDLNPRHKQRPGLANDALAPEDFERFLRDFIVAAQPFFDGDVYCVLGAAEWPRLDMVLREEGMHWSATIIWVKHIFVLGRSKYHRRYEPLWYGWNAKKRSSFCGPRDLDDVWELDRPRVSDEHPTMKPVELMGRAIRNSSKVGDVVLDPFGGSGSTLIAAEQTERRACLIEIDPAYCDVIVRRWERFTGRKAARLAPGTPPRSPRRASPMAKAAP